MALPPSQRKREVHVVANDTLVESPPVVRHMKDSMEAIRIAIGKHELPMQAKITAPAVDQTFWVNVIGRGYIPPTRNFRWCTDRLKITPTTEMIKSITRTHRRTMLLVGTRKAESSSRRRRMESHAKTSHDRRMSPHNQIENCRIFAPIADLTDNEVWAILLQSRPPWGGTHRNLITLYRNAGGGECPLVLSKEDAPSCGTTSPRFGCWTCTVISKDRSLGGMISAGEERLEPLYAFREWLVSLREDNGSRMRIRRDCTVKYRDGRRVMGPFTIEVRKKILKRLLALEEELGEKFLSSMEKEVIEDIWWRDEIDYECYNALSQSVAIQGAA